MTSEATIALRSATNRTRSCSCGAPVRWATTIAGRPICLEAAAMVSREGDELRVRRDSVHWSNCPHGDQHRKRGPAADARQAVEERFAPLQKEVRDLRQLFDDVVEQVKGGATRREIVELIETRLRDIGPRGPAIEDVYPEGRRRWCGD